MRIIGLLPKKPETKATSVDIRETFNLWDILNSKYMTLERILVCKAFVEDADLKMVLKKMEQEIEENITILQKLMKKYNIISPNKNKVAIANQMNKELFSDDAIAMQLLLYEQEHVENLVLAVYSFVTNDDLRKVIMGMLLRTMKTADKLMKHVAIRGWVGIPPAYQHLPAEITEKIHCGEAGCLWDLLTYRYDTLHFTEIMVNLIKDADLKLIFTAGIQLLKEQTKQLESELVHFGINLPKRPAEVTVALNNKDLWEDSHIFRMTLMSMQGAGTLHVRAFKKLSLNHRLRAYLMKLLRQEVEKINDLFLYGKLKGWLQQVPKYGP